MKQLNYKPIGSVLLRLCGVVKRFFNWYKIDNSPMMPTPSNAQWFWMGVIAFILIILKVLQEVNLIEVWVIS